MYGSNDDMGNGICFVNNSDGFCEGAEGGYLDSG